MNQQEIVKFEQQSPIKKISRLHRLNLNRLAKPMAEIEMARGTLPFLMEVLCCEGLIQKDISQALSIDPAATARAIQQLEKTGFVKRQENKDNRRQKCVYSTGKTREIQDRIIHILEEQKKLLFDGFTDEEKITFLDMLDRMLDNMDNEQVKR